MLESTRVGPLPQHGLDESFGFAVGARGIGSCAHMFDVQARTCAFESARQKGWAVISHHALDAHAQPLVESTNGVEKDQRRALLLVGQNLRTRHPRAIIHGDKDVFITYPAHAICALAGDPMAHPRYARKLLDIDMHKFSWSIFLIAYNRHRGFQTGQPVTSTR